MNLTAFVDLLSIVIGFIAALYFCVGSALLRRDTISELSGTYWGTNPHFAAFLRSLKADYFCGGIALCITFALQFLANAAGFLPLRMLFDNSSDGTFAALASGVVFGVLLLFLRAHLRKTLEEPKPEENVGH